MSGLVRRATVDHLDELLDVQERGAVVGLAHIFSQENYPFPRPTVRERWRDEFADPRVRIYVSVDGAGLITGFAAVRGNELMHFGTALHTWGTGTAQLLHDEVVNEWTRARARAEDRMSLRVFADNLRARRFYERLGWTPTGRVTRTSFPPHPVLLEYELQIPAVAEPQLRVPPHANAGE